MPRAAFGLTPPQLEHVQATWATGGLVDCALRTPIGHGECSRNCDRGSNRNPAPRGALGRVTLADELKDLSCGTAWPRLRVRRPRPHAAPRRRRCDGWSTRPSPSKGRSRGPSAGPPTNVRPTNFRYSSKCSTSRSARSPSPKPSTPFAGGWKCRSIFDRNAMALHGADPTTAPAEVPAKYGCRTARC